MSGNIRQGRHLPREGRARPASRAYPIANVQANVPPICIHLNHACTTFSCPTDMANLDGVFNDLLFNVIEFNRLILPRLHPISSHQSFVGTQQESQIDRYLIDFLI